ncbi:MAG: flagellar hook-basal body complex protein [Sedimentisphaerales bacterium]|jgi:flagellar hook protein FlgE
MSSALSAGVSGLKAFQQMLDVAGNNIANVNTTAYKTSTIHFSELLSETIKKASQPTTTTGGTNPVQVGSGVGVSGIVANTTQGDIESTGNALDMALEGQGYFVLNDGSQNVFTRAGSFSVDENCYLVDSSTGYRVQRIGNYGEAEGFQVSGDSDLRIPYDVAMAASATKTVTVSGNLSSDGHTTAGQTNVLTASDAFTIDGGTAATANTTLGQLDQWTNGTLTNATFGISGFNHDGTAIVDTNKLTASDAFTVSSAAATGATTLSSLDQFASGTLTNATITVSGLNHGGTALDDATPMSVTNTTTVNDLIAHINTVLDAGGTAGANGVASLVDGKIVVTDAKGGYSQSAITLTFGNSGDAGLTLPSTFTATGPLAVTSSTTIQDLIDHINTELGDSGTATLVNGKITITDSQGGYSLSDVDMAFANSGTASLKTSPYFDITTVGGDEVKSVSISVYDNLGSEHVLSAAFVRTNTANTWDMVLTSITGDVSSISADGRRISGIDFNKSDGSLAGLDTAIGDTSAFTVSFAADPDNPQTIGVSMGTVGQLDGLTQFAGGSTAVASGQDGYSAGRLSSVSADNQGLLIGAFSNGVKKTIGAVEIALFQNPAGLEATGSNYFVTSANSGEAVYTQAMSGGAGTLQGGSLEKSNADTATEFVNLITAQNGFQANTRTIKVASEILQELATLIT